MGSAGRFEQALWSDQDHGIIYTGTEKHQQYFQKLGLEISEGFSLCGYERCDGKVMASNELWCRSVHQWEAQLTKWLMDETWASLRNFSIFFDSRVLMGDKNLLAHLKTHCFKQIDQSNHVYTRLVGNMGNMRKPIGLFGHFLTEKYGPYAGTIHLKQRIFFPYVNAIRLLALREKVFKSSTISRVRELSDKFRHIKLYEEEFMRLLELRLKLQQDCKNYEEVQHIPISNLTKADKRQLKRITNSGYKLWKETKSILLKGV